MIGITVISTGGVWDVTKRADGVSYLLIQIPRIGSRSIKVGIIPVLSGIDNQAKSQSQKLLSEMKI